MEKLYRPTTAIIAVTILFLAIAIGISRYFLRNFTILQEWSEFPMFVVAAPRRYQLPVQDLTLANMYSTVYPSSSVRTNYLFPSFDNTSSLDVDNAVNYFSPLPSFTNSFFNINCNNVEVFPKYEFLLQNNDSYFLVEPTSINSNSLFYAVGFTKYVRTFDVYLLATKLVDDSILTRGSRILSSLLDEDADGVPDKPEVIKMIQKYLLVVGYFANEEEANDFWSNKYFSDKGIPFREQYDCNMHFSEFWASLVNPGFEIVKRGDEENTELCRKAREQKFDWSVWFYSFILSYYGYLEVIPLESKDQLARITKQATNEGIFVPQYSNGDIEMENAEMLAWMIVTMRMELNCHCGLNDVSKHWKLCTLEDIINMNSSWMDWIRLQKVIPWKFPLVENDIGQQEELEMQESEEEKRSETNLLKVTNNNFPLTEEKGESEVEENLYINVDDRIGTGRTGIRRRDGEDKEIYDQDIQIIAVQEVDNRIGSSLVAMENFEDIESAIEEKERKDINYEVFGPWTEMGNEKEEKILADEVSQWGLDDISLSSNGSGSEWRKEDVSSNNEDKKLRILFEILKRRFAEQGRDGKGRRKPVEKKEQVEDEINAIENDYRINGGKTLLYTSHKGVEVDNEEID